MNTPRNDGGRAGPYHLSEESDQQLGDSNGGTAPLVPLGARISAPISLVMPMYNESPCVALTLQEALGYLERHFVNFEIVVADDASTDDSAEQVARWAAREPRIRLVRLQHNERFGGALRAGLAAARYEFIFYTDFDLQVGLSCLPRMLDELADADVLTGYSADVVKHSNWRSELISRGYNFLVRSLFGLRLPDINFGFKALRRTVWEQLTLRSRSPFVDAELFVQVQRLGYSIKTVAVPFSLRQAGASHMRRLDVIAWTLLDMARLRLAPPRLKASGKKSQVHEVAGH